MLKLTLSLPFENTHTNKEVELTPDDAGNYRVEIGWRYALKSGVVLDSILKTAGLTYVRRPPGEYYEIWRAAIEPIKPQLQVSSNIIIDTYDEYGNLTSKR